MLIFGSRHLSHASLTFVVVNFYVWKALDSAIKNLGNPRLPTPHHNFTFHKLTSASGGGASQNRETAGDGRGTNEEKLNTSKFKPTTNYNQFVK